MGRPLSCSHDELLDRLEQVFRVSGYEAASLAHLAKASGLAKAALYHRFPQGKEAMAAAVLDRIGLFMAEQVVDPLLQAGDPRVRLQRMAEALDRYYRGGKEACLVEMFSIEGTPPVFRTQLRDGMLAWCSAIQAVVTDAGIAPDEANRRAVDALSRIQGALVVSRVLADPTPFAELIARLADDLLAPSTSQNEAPRTPFEERRHD